MLTKLLSLRAYYAALLLLATSESLPAQKHGSSTEIRAMEESFDTRIEECESSEDPCGLYLNVIQFNPKMEPWPAVGIYSTEQRQWFEAVEEEEGRSYVLRKVEVVTHVSARLERETYFFDASGDLLHFSFVMGEEGEESQECAYFFDGTSVMEYEERLEEVEKAYQVYTVDDGEMVWENARKIKAVFEGIVN